MAENVGGGDRVVLRTPFIDFGKFSIQVERSSRESRKIENFNYKRNSSRCFQKLKRSNRKR